MRRDPPSNCLPTLYPLPRLQRAQEELLRERARHQRRERQLLAEVGGGFWRGAGGWVGGTHPSTDPSSPLTPPPRQLAELKASERRLQQRVKTLTAELASCRRG